MGWLTSGRAELRTLPEPELGGSIDSFMAELGEYGYVLGRNLVLEYRETDRGPDQLIELAAELSRLPVDVIVATAGVGPYVQQATATTPVVLAGGGDPVAAGLVPSLARPGGNITGVVAGPGAQFVAKPLELLQQAAPSVSRVGLLYDATVSAQMERAELAPGGPLQLGARALALELWPMPVQSGAEIEGAFETGIHAGVDALQILSTKLLGGANRERIVELALRYKLPSVSFFRNDAEAGALLSYGPSLQTMFRRASYFVDRILKGTKPADLPIEQPMTFDFVVNMKTARELGITFPREILLQVTEVIE